VLYEVRLHRSLARHEGRFVNKLLRAALIAAACGCAAVAFGCGFLVAAMVVRNPEWVWRDLIFGKDMFIGHPFRYLVGMACGGAMAAVLACAARTPPRPWRAMAARALLLAVALGVSLGLGEIALRLYLVRAQGRIGTLEQLRSRRDHDRHVAVKSKTPLAVIIEPSVDTNVIYELIPRLDRDFGHRRLVTNGDGMRESRDYPRERTPGVLRIVGIGDSGMFGWSCEQDEDYLAVLEKNLNASSSVTRAEVLNLGTPGYNTAQEVALLKKDGLPYRPDIVVLGWSVNDFDPPFLRARHEPVWRWDRSHAFDLLFHRNRFWATLAGSEIVGRGDVEGGESAAGETDDGISRVRSAAAELSRLSRQHGFHVLAFGTMRDIAEQTLGEAGLDTANAARLLEGNDYPKEWAVFGMHPRAEGHRVLGAALEQELRRRGWLGGRPDPASPAAGAGSPP
jgi:lysophospholipase L1-like esterase